MFQRRRPAAVAAALACLAAGALARPARAPAAATLEPNETEDSLSGAASSRVLGQLPDGEEKRRFITDCTGCHQMGVAQAYPGGRARTRAASTGSRCPRPTGGRIGGW